MADRLGIPTAHGRYEDLLADPGVDVVYIPLPNHLHAEWTIAALRAGKHVLCEKPLAMTADDAQRMVDVAHETGRQLMEAFMYRHHPSWVAALDLVESGRIGTLTAVQTWFSYFNDDPTNIRNIREYGGGALFDIGCYAVNLSRMVFGGEPSRVQASLRRDPVSGVDVLTSGLLDFERGIATFACSTRAEDDQRVDIYGTTGRISIDIPFNIPPDRSTRIRVTAGGELRSRVRLLTVSFDPARDRPEAMAALRQRLAPQSDWRFLTAPDAAMLAPVLRDFGQDAVPELTADGMDSGAVRHVVKVFLVDPQGGVRNIYSTGFLDHRLLLRDVETLLLAE